MTRRVLVTGASGFIGRQALSALRQRGYEVHAVARRPLPIDGVRWHAADLLSEPAQTELLAAVRPSHLLHFAWYAEHGKFWTSPENRRWVDATVALVQAFQRAGGRWVAATGSCAEYDWANGRCDELTTPRAPSTEYGACKRAAHARLEEICRASNLSCAWGRIFHLYGPHENPARFVASIIGALLQGKVAACTEGSQLRDFLHVEDVAGAMVALLDARADGPFNIGSGQPVTLADLGRRIATLIGRPELLQLGARPVPAGEPPVLIPEIGRLKRAVAWAPRYTIDAGLRHAIEWWRRELRGDSAA